MLQANPLVASFAAAALRAAIVSSLVVTTSAASYAMAWTKASVSVAVPSDSHALAFEGLRIKASVTAGPVHFQERRDTQVWRATATTAR